MLRTSTQTSKKILGIALVLAAILPPSLASAQKKKPKKPTPAPTATASETAAPSATETATATATVSAAPIETTPVVTATASATVDAAPPPPAPAPPPAASAPMVESHVKPPPPHQAVERHVTVPIVVSGIVSGVALISGVVFSISAASKHSSYASQPDQEVGLAGERSMFIADISYGVSALFGLTALALYIFPDEQEPPPPPPPSTATAKTGANQDCFTRPAHAASAKRLPWYAAAVLGAPVSF